MGFKKPSSHPILSLCLATLSCASFGFVVTSRHLGFAISRHAFIETSAADSKCNPNAARQVSNSPLPQSAQPPMVSVTSSTHSFRNAQQHERVRAEACAYRHYCARKDNKPPPSSKPSPTLQLVQEGFAHRQAAQILTFYASRKLHFDAINVRHWLCLLKRRYVERPRDAICRCPIILAQRAESFEDRSAANTQWMIAKGLTHVHIGCVFSKAPFLLVVTLANMEAVEAWLSRELNWNSAIITLAQS